MAINITGLSTNDKNTIQYRDIALDLQENETPSRDTLYGKVTRTDLRTLNDEASIVNCIKNIFTTIPGQKILNPAFGVDLTRWLFEPISEFRGREMAEVIISSIEKFEPRVLVTNIEVTADISGQAYIIKLSLQIPGLNITRTFDGALNADGFDLLTKYE